MDSPYFLAIRLDEKIRVLGFIRTGERFLLDVICHIGEFFDQFNKSVIKTGAKHSFTQSIHKVIHRVCGQLGFVWKDGKLAPKVKLGESIGLMGEKKYLATVSLWT